MIGGEETTTLQRPQDQRAAVSRDAILDAAERILTAHGPGRLTIDAIAAEASFSKGGVLHHFKSKQDIMIAMLDRVLERFESRIQELYAEGAGKRSYLNAHVRAKIERARDDLDLPRIIIGAAATWPDLLKPFSAMYESSTRRVMEEADDPALALVIKLASDGLMFSSVFGLIDTAGPVFAMAEKQLLSAEP